MILFESPNIISIQFVLRFLTPKSNDILSLSRRFQINKLAKPLDTIQDDDTQPEEVSSNLATKFVGSPTSLMANKSAKPTSKVQRLKNRLAPKNPPNSASSKQNPTNANCISKDSVASASSSSGFSSSLSLIEEEEASRVLQTSVKYVHDKADDCAQTARLQTASVPGQQVAQNKLETNANARNEPQNSIIVNEDYYKLCQCSECRRSGQPIYSAARPPTPPKSAPRKAVSFRNCVEHIGACGQSDRVPLPKADDMWPMSSNNLNDSCDSLHVTKDLSLVNLVAESTLPANIVAQNQCVRPLDSSTPKQTNNTANQQQSIQVEVHQAPNAQRRLSKGFGVRQSQLIQNQAAADYTCLCSPDFICVHNYPQLANCEPSDKSPHGSSLVARAATAAAAAAKNLHYGNVGASISGQTSDYRLTSDCLDCNNISTYVNLSASSRDLLPPTRGSQNNNINWNQLRIRQASFEDSLSKQAAHENSNLYGNVWHPNSNTNVAINNEALTTDLAGLRKLEQTIAECQFCNAHLQASAEAANIGLQLKRHEQQPTHQVSNLHLINAANNNNNLLVDNNSEHIKSYHYHQAPMQSHRGDQEKPCSCMGSNVITTTATATAGAATALDNNSSALANKSWDISTSSKSFHTAQSNSFITIGNGNSELSVLPVVNHNNNNDYKILPDNKQANFTLHQQGNKLAKSNEESQQHQQQLECNIMGSNQQNCMDSSLSSLFVYRHLSDDNQPTTTADEFDPDSLEIIRPLNESKAQHRLASSNRFSHPQTTNSWLKTRPKSDYITLSSTSTSTNSIQTQRERRGSSLPPEAAQNKSSNAKSASNRAGINNNSSSTIRVDPDLSHSSLAKRRQQKQQQPNQILHQHQQQQHNQQNLSNKFAKSAKLTSSKSTPNLSSSAKNNKSSRSNLNKSSRSTGSTSNVKSIYQCVKNLLDITKPSSSTNSSAFKKLKQNRQQPKQQQSAGLLDEPVGSSASLPRNLALSSSSTFKSVPKKLTGRKAQIQVCIPLLVNP